MASRKPLVLNGGQIEQLQAGDTLDTSSIAGGNMLTQTNDEAGSIVIGTPVYTDAADGVKKARANASGTVNVLGVVAQAAITAAASGSIQIDGVLAASTAQWDAITGETGGLTPGARYYLDPSTAGMLTQTAPSTVGQFIVEVGLAVSTTEMRVDPKTPILL